MIKSTKLNEAQVALSVVAARTECLVGSLPDTAAPIPGSAWTVREAAVHLAVIGFHYAGMVHGEPSQYPSLAPDACARLNDQLNADIPESDPARLAALMHEAMTHLLAAVASCRDTQEVLFHGGAVIAVPRLLSVALAEHLLHGSDIALAVDRPWLIDPDYAALALSGSGPSYGLSCPSASTTERNMT